MHTGINPDELQSYSTQTGTDCKSLVCFTPSETATEIVFIPCHMTSSSRAGLSPFPSAF